MKATKQREIIKGEIERNKKEEKICKDNDSKLAAYYKGKVVAYEEALRIIRRLDMPKEKIVYVGGHHVVVCNKKEHYKIFETGIREYEGKCCDWANCPNK